MEDHRPQFQATVQASNTLIGVCHELAINNDVVVVINDIEEIKRRWEVFTTRYNEFGFPLLSDVLKLAI